MTLTSAIAVLRFGQSFIFICSCCLLSSPSKVPLTDKRNVNDNDDNNDDDNININNDDYDVMVMIIIIILS